MSLRQQHSTFHSFEALVTTKPMCLAVEKTRRIQILPEIRATTVKNCELKSFFNKINNYEHQFYRIFTSINNRDKTTEHSSLLICKNSKRYLQEYIWGSWDFIQHAVLILFGSDNVWFKMG